MRRKRGWKPRRVAGWGAVKILIVAYACAPGEGSEPSVGWNVAAIAARRHQVWVLLDAHNRAWVERDAEAAQRLGAELVYLTLPWPFSRLFSIRWRGYLYYALWQAAAFFKARRLHRQIGFDLIHHVTYQNSWVPVLTGWAGPPLVWNGGRRDVVPLRLARRLGWRGALAEVARAAVMGLFRLVTDCVVVRRAAVILSLAPARCWPAGRRVEAVACGGLSEEESIRLSRIRHRRSSPFRMASIGRLFALKGTAFALKAFARLRAEIPQAEYWIIGDGPERRRLEQLALRLGCADSVRFLGWQPRDQLFALLEEIDVLVHLSLRDAFGYVVLEAMAAGRPVICLDAGGPAAIVGSEGGAVIPSASPERIIEQLVETLRIWARHADLRESIGRRARTVALERFRWSGQEEALDRIYQLAAGSGVSSEASRPRPAVVEATGH